MTAMDARPMVSLHAVNKHFGELHVLRNIELEVQPKEVVVVVGPSGSGKSTLCRSINRLETIDGGEIRVDGELLPVEGAALARLRADVGMVFQSFNLFAHRTILDNVALAPIKVRGMKKAAAEAEALELLDRAASPRRPTATPPSSRAASSSAPPSPVRSPCTPR
jgi:glutamate transport system ATP-binding protein